MILGLGLLALGLALPFLWGAYSDGGAAAVHAFALLLIAASGASFARAIARELRAARRAKTRPGEVAVASLFLLACALAVLLLEGGSSLWILAAGRGDEIGEFRRRQLFRGDPLKVPHPFLILVNNRTREESNSLGFLDKEWVREKPPGRIRVACTGASTTEDGYPALLETNLRIDHPNLDIEVMNFGNSGWTSAQSLINYCLNIQHFSPDIVVIHDAANEIKVRGFAGFRTDYSHALGILQTPPLRPDAPLVRHSDAYAAAKMLWTYARGANAGLSVYDVIIKPNLQPKQLEPAELAPYRANLDDLAALALRNGSKVLFATMPYSKTNASWGGHFPGHMAEANDIMRGVAAKNSAPVCDLDQLITGREEDFVDPVHLTPEAIRLKARTLAGALAPLLPAAP